MPPRGTSAGGGCRNLAARQKAFPSIPASETKRKDCEMNLRERAHKTGQLGTFMRVESPPKPWPCRWLRRIRSFTRLLHSRNEDVRSKEVAVTRPAQDNNAHFEEHLCYMISQGFNVSDETRYVALITGPKFRCGHCARQAASDRSLCVPMELS